MSEQRAPQQQLSIQGKAGSPIWIMADGTEDARIGIRLDSGDGGVVFVSEDQALDLADQLNKIVAGLSTLGAASLPESQPSPSGDLQNLLCNVAQILDVVKREWGESWSAWDQEQRDAISKHLRSHDAKVSGQAERDQDEYCTRGCGQFSHHPPTGDCPLEQFSPTGQAEQSTK